MRQVMVEQKLKMAHAKLGVFSGGQGMRAPLPEKPLVDITKDKNAQTDCDKTKDSKDFNNKTMD